MPPGIYKRIEADKKRLRKMVLEIGKKTRFKKGHPQYNTGRTWWKKGGQFIGDENPAKRPEVGEKISEALKKRWDKIGRKKYKRPKHQGSQYRNWVKRVFQYDNYTCWICENRGGRLVAHHLFSWNLFSKLRYKLWNGLTLCEWCHKTYTNFYEARNKKNDKIRMPEL